MKVRVDSYNTPEAGRKRKNKELPERVVTSSSEWFEIEPAKADALEKLLYKHFGDHFQLVHQMDLTVVAPGFMEKPRKVKK